MPSEYKDIGDNAKDSKGSWMICDDCLEKDKKCRVTHMRDTVFFCKYKGALANLLSFAKAHEGV